jgi:hypothetical protein
MKVIVIVLSFFISLGIKAESKEQVIYEYKKYEKFDLGNLEVKGELIAPGDISVRERDRKRFGSDFYIRDSFKQQILDDIRALR